jgi:DNA polymerase III epsilon subunit-like protein
MTTPRYVFVSCIANGPVNWKASLTAEGQPGIADCHMIYVGDDEIEIPDASAAALVRYSNLIGGGAIVVGHSVEFHAGILRAAMLAAGIDPHDGRVNTICTMLGLTGRVQKHNGRKGWPTFDEACEHFGVTRAGTETAEDNARCLAKIFAGMQTIGAVPQPRIWKDRHA